MRTRNTLDVYAEPLAPPPRPSPFPSSPASFASLPPELKSRIARHVQDNDNDSTVKSKARPAPLASPQERNAFGQSVREFVLGNGERNKDELARMMARVLATALPCWTGLDSLGLADKSCYFAARNLRWKVRFPRSLFLCTRTGLTFLR
jgi:hypothetical protein